jgi:protoheme IX farnesyltransferase
MISWQAERKWRPFDLPVFPGKSKTILLHCELCASVVKECPFVLNTSIIRWLHILLQLTKFKISLFAALSTATGFILANQGLSYEIIPAVTGVFLLAGGACGLNQYQEREPDRLMERTQNRPIPSGRLSSSAAMKIALILLFTGALILCFGPNRSALVLGLSAVFLYNGVYTPLKKRTAFAVIPGGLIGAIPPVVGWVSDGKPLLSPPIMAIAFLFFIWQVPHFWLLLLNSERDYEMAGFPTLTRIFTPVQLRRITFVWVFGTAVAAVVTPLFVIMESQVVYGGLFASACWLVWKAFGLLKARPADLSPQLTFNAINSYILVVMVLLVLKSL